MAKVTLIDGPRSNNYQAVNGNYHFYKHQPVEIIDKEDIEFFRKKQSFKVSVVAPKKAAPKVEKVEKKSKKTKKKKED